MPDAGAADLVRLHGERVGVDIAESVADFVDQNRQVAVGAVAEIDRQRIGSAAKQPGIAQQQDAAATETIPCSSAQRCA